MEEAKASFKEFADFSYEQKLREVEEARKKATAAIGVELPEKEEPPPELAKFPVVQEYLKKLKELKDTMVTRDQVQSILSLTHEFFSRYYEDGDFISKRKYGGKDHYSLPYKGEEVLLYWANFDQYYVKTSEYYNRYSFKTGNLRVDFRIHLPEQTETDHSDPPSSTNGDRYYILASEEPVEFDKGNLVLTLWFEHRALTEDEERKYGRALQAIFTQDALKSLGQKKFESKDELLRPQADGPSLLEKHLGRFVKRNTSDFFVHKDLGGFFAREFDFFLKNEVVDLDELRNANPEQVKNILAKTRALKRIVGRIIDFLAQIEDFQRRLFEKRKFVLRTDFLITLDRVPSEFYEEIGKNTKQVAEWKAQFELDKATDESLYRTREKDVLDIPFLQSHKFLVLDTKYFTQDFKDRLLSRSSNLDHDLDGLIIKAENWQALNLLANKYQGKVQCFYLDPPYNTGTDEFLYKDRYQHSSWLSMMVDRLAVAKKFLHPSGTIGISIDNNELDELLKLMDSIFGRENRRSIIAVKRGSVTGPKVINPGVVNISEFLVVYSASKSEWKPNRIFRERARDKRYNQFIQNRDKEYSKWSFIPLLQAFAKSKGIPKGSVRKSLGDSFEEELNKFILDNADAVARTAALDPTKISQQATALKEKSVSNSEKVFLLKREDHEDWYIVGGERILFYSDRLISLGAELVPGEPITDIWEDTLPNDLHNEGGVTLKKGKKPEKLIGRLIELATNKGDLVMDFFLGSGTACAAAQKLGRKSIGVELADFFDDLTLRRMKNMMHGEQSGISQACGWKGGGFFKYLYLEQYEDSLGNIIFEGAEREAQATLEGLDGYKLKYMLDYESRSSPVLLDPKQFATPFEYKLNADLPGETPVDLMETFGLLIGLNVETAKSYKLRRGKLCRIVTGRTEFGDTAVIWREIEEIPPDQKDDMIDREKYFRDFVNEKLLRDRKFDKIYVNGDSLISGAETIEAEFRRLMNQSVGVSS